jgi:hypothetical protein
MPTIMQNFGCLKCGHVQEELLHGNYTAGAPYTADDVKCEECGGKMSPEVPATHTFSTIVPTTNTSKRHKAGYVHQYVDRPAEKTSVGPMGGVTKGVHKGTGCLNE